MLTTGQKRALRREVFDAVVSLAMVGGGMAGLLWAMDRPEPTPPASCSRGGHSTDGIGECIGESLLGSVMPYLVAVGGGGLVCGLLAALLLRGLFRNRLGGRRRGAARGRWITARYFGPCSGCSGAITPGDRIQHSRGRAVCDSCAS
ncbi:MAG: hypothetical protein M3134_12140 [Actinomycetota bacterium]|nr:hypothetical protein [Actinomycetota bacterium]